MLRFYNGFVGSDGVLSFVERLSYGCDGVFQGENYGFRVSTLRPWKDGFRCNLEPDTEIRGL